MKRYRKYNIKAIRHMYIEENMTVQQIADEIGCTYIQLKSYLAKYGIVKNEYISSEELTGKKIEKKPYYILDNHHVFYNGRIYEKMSKEQIKENLLKQKG